MQEIDDEIPPYNVFKVYQDKPKSTCLRSMNHENSAGFGADWVQTSNKLERAVAFAYFLLRPSGTVKLPPTKFKRTEGRNLPLGIRGVAALVFLFLDRSCLQEYVRPGKASQERSKIISEIFSTRTYQRTRMEIHQAIGDIHLGLFENVGYIPNEIAIFHRDNDQQNHWVWGLGVLTIFRQTHLLGN